VTVATGRLLAVNVGAPREVTTAGGRVVRTAIFKAPVAGRVAVRGVNLAGDDQADRSVHGGPDKAVYAYASEDTAWWTAAGRGGLGPGAFGENLTTAGIEVSGAVVGERWLVGTTELEVCQPRLPCFKLGLRMGDPAFVKVFGRAGRPGAYLRIVREGDVGAGDAVEVVHRPAHGVTVALAAHAFLHDRRRIPELAPATELPADWRAFVAGRAAAG
jgi:MOSC domain-containing protein YiiM